MSYYDLKILCYIYFVRGRLVSKEALDINNMEINYKGVQNWMTHNLFMPFSSGHFKDYQFFSGKISKNSHKIQY